MSDKDDAYARWKATLMRREDILGGSVTFPGTRLSVTRVGTMARRGMSAREIIEDYPQLDELDVVFARRYVREQ